MDILRTIDLIVIHCSATPNGRWQTVGDIARMHGARKPPFMRDPRLIGANQPQLKHIGYHYVIYTTGPVVIGRGLNEIGAHAQGHNAQSIGICMFGTDRYSRAQWESLKKLVQVLQTNIPDVRIVGHRDLSPDLNGNGVIEPHERTKTSPGFDVKAWLRNGMEPMPGHILEMAPRSRGSCGTAPRRSSTTPLPPRWSRSKPPAACCSLTSR